jgi:hypothetical protein
MNDDFDEKSMSDSSDEEDIDLLDEFDFVNAIRNPYAKILKDQKEN